jgi:phosphate:Na+ symporter
MTIFSIFTIFGGLAFFIYGMTQMSSSLEKIAGGKMEVILNKMTSNRFMGLLTGALITIAIQSSSAVTVMLVGLVNSGIMDISNTVGVIMGSNIGTTVTAWIMSMVGISSKNVFVQMLKPENFSPVLALIGIIMMMVCKSKRKKDIGNGLVGFAILMYGMQLMSNSVSPLSESPKFQALLTTFNNPFLGILTGLIVTAVIQSSAASIGMLQAISMTGSLTWSMAIPIIMGQNIGTCATALISSIGTNRHAKRVAVIHILFNVIGTAIFMVAYFIIKETVDLAFLDENITPVGIAMFHSIFNICTTVMLLPFTNQLVKIAKKLIKTEDRNVSFLDDRLLNTPAVAVAECFKQSVEMSKVALNCITGSFDLIFSYDTEKAAQVEAMEQEVDVFQDSISSFLIKVSSQNLSESDSRLVSLMLHATGDWERISDHAMNILTAGESIKNDKLALSDDAKREMKVMISALKEILSITEEAYEAKDTDAATKVEPLEQVVDGLIDTMKRNHVVRLKKGICTIQNGIILSNIMTDCERVSDHCSNIAVALIELTKGSFDTHEYLYRVKNLDNDKFQEMYDEYGKKYHISAFGSGN